jgi:hypothetical protein
MQNIYVLVACFRFCSQINHKCIVLLSCPGCIRICSSAHMKSLWIFMTAIGIFFMKVLNDLMWLLRGELWWCSDVVWYIAMLNHMPLSLTSFNLLFFACYIVSHESNIALCICLRWNVLDSIAAFSKEIQIQSETALFRCPVPVQCDSIICSSRIEVRGTPTQH